jgi:hypothetical protein
MPTRVNNPFSFPEMAAMNDRNRGIHRRAMLRNAGALMALPFLESLLPAEARAAAAAKPPLRFGIFTTTGGTVLESWTPKEVGPLTKMSSILRPLDFAKEDVVVVSGLSHASHSENLNGHENCAFAHLTGAPVIRKAQGRVWAGVSVDQAMADAIGKETILPSIEIGLTNQETRYSYKRADVPVPYEANPRLVFDRMFRGRKPVVPNWNRRAGEGAVAETGKSDSAEQSVIDLVLDQAKDLRKSAGRSDREKLDTYLESVRTVEKRIAFVEGRHRQEILDLASPGPSKLVLPDNLPKEGTPYWQITRPIYEDPEKHGDYIRLMSDLMVLAFQTDTTRVATFAVGDDGAMFPGVVTVGYERHCHTLEHQGNAGRVEDADPIAREACRQIHEWYTLLFAEMVRKMKAIDEGGSSLLDNSLLMYTSYMADGGHGRDHYPVLLAGKAGGALKTGRHIAFEKKIPMANLVVESMNLMGVPTKTFGDSHVSRYAGNYDGRVPGLVG